MKLEPCRSCARHVRPDESVCPFCGAALARPLALQVAAAVTAAALAAAIACKDDPVVVPPYGIPPVPDASVDGGTGDAGS